MPLISTTRYKSYNIEVWQYLDASYKPHAPYWGVVTAPGVHIETSDQATPEAARQEAELQADVCIAIAGGKDETPR